MSGAARRRGGARAPSIAAATTGSGRDELEGRDVGAVALRVPCGLRCRSRFTDTAALWSMTQWVWLSLRMPSTWPRSMGVLLGPRSPGAARCRRLSATSNAWRSAVAFSPPRPLRQSQFAHHAGDVLEVTVVVQQREVVLDGDARDEAVDGAADGDTRGAAGAVDARGLDRAEPRV